VTTAASGAPTTVTTGVVTNPFAGVDQRKGSLLSWSDDGDDDGVDEEDDGTEISGGGAAPVFSSPRSCTDLRAIPWAIHA
jgi:hypothetical protein